MANQPSKPQLAAMFAVIAALNLFSLVVAFGWATHTLPESGNVLSFALGGMVVVGGCLGFAVSALANIMLRFGPPKFRIPLTGVAWLGFCGFCYVGLLSSGADAARSLTLTALAGLFGLLIGPYHAELFVGLWFYKRGLKVIEAERDVKLAEIKRDHVRKQAELQRRFNAERDARLNEQERRSAIRNYFRS